MSLRRIHEAAVLALLVSGAGLARAQAADTAAAEALFQEGRALLLEEKVDLACPKLESSYQIDPATGTLMALALCHEKQGKLASAWAEYTDVIGRSRREGREDREQGARERATALRPRLSTLRIQVSDATAATAGLEIRRDRVVQSRGVWNSGVPVDGGSHVVEVTAPGRKTWKANVAVKAEGDAATLTVPELETASSAPAPAAATVDAPAAPAAAETRADEPSKPFGTLEWTGIGTGAAGVVVLGVGAYFLATALGERSDSEKDCKGNLCNEAGLATREDMVGHGNVATGLGIGGAVLIGAGVTLYLVGRSSGGDAPPQASVSLSLCAQPRGAGAGVVGAF
jgi:hypothetical protein